VLTRDATASKNGTPEIYPYMKLQVLHVQAHAKELQTFEVCCINQIRCAIQLGKIINYVVRNSIKFEISTPTPIFKNCVQYLF
jgi:hypothetical protein